RTRASVLNDGLGRTLQPYEQCLVVGMGTNPKPDDGVAIQDADRPVPTINTCRVDRKCGVSLLESQRRMTRIRRLKRVGRGSFVLDWLWKSYQLGPELLRSAREHE